jgi:transcriptional regulator with XRE-family HTH domain
MMRFAMNGPGRPTLYKPEYAEIAHNYCLLGATNDELAGFFGVSPSTVDNWLSGHPGFATAVRNGRAAADASIARKLYRRADGYDYTAEKIFVYRGEVIRADHKVHRPPDVGACIFWLRNRRREQWLERAKPEPDNGLTFEDLEEASERVRRAHEEQAREERAREERTHDQ